MKKEEYLNKCRRLYRYWNQEEPTAGQMKHAEKLWNQAKQRGREYDPYEAIGDMLVLVINKSISKKK
jgi:hypothetical protein